MAAAELVAYGALTVAATALLERRLIREVFGYLRRPGGTPVPTASASGNAAS
jgi:hypothetical protein